MCVSEGQWCCLDLQLGPLCCAPTVLLLGDAIPMSDHWVETLFSVPQSVRLLSRVETGKPGVCVCVYGIARTKTTAATLEQIGLKMETDCE